MGLRDDLGPWGVIDRYYDGMSMILPMTLELLAC